MDDDTVIFGTNFLDGIDIDFPKGVWSIQLDSQKRNVTVRNLLWPGSYGFHRLNSGNYGGVYIGDGIKNIDLPFMI
jgi:radial spoke head protein 9